MPENYLQEKNEITIVAHNASFHPDDVFAVATIMLANEQGRLGGDAASDAVAKTVNVIRSRKPEDIAHADYVVDVGGEYDPARNRYDHHQTGGAGKRDNGIPYASFGLVWRHIGKMLCRDEHGSDNDALWQKIDNELVAAIDANDNGFDLSKNLIDGVYVPTLSLRLMILKPTWEERSSDDHMYERFMQAVAEAKQFLERYLVVQRASIKARKEIRDTYNASQNKSIIVFAHDYERINFVYTLAELPDIMFMVYPNHSGTWTAETVPVGTGSFEKRKSFPAAWAGLSGEALIQASGVEDAYFCHNGLFVAYAASEAGALKLAKIALEL